MDNTHSCHQKKDGTVHLVSDFHFISIANCNQSHIHYWISRTFCRKEVISKLSQNLMNQWLSIHLNWMWILLIYALLCYHGASFITSTFQSQYHKCQTYFKLLWPACSVHWKRSKISLMILMIHLMNIFKYHHPSWQWFYSQANQIHTSYAKDKVSQIHSFHRWSLTHAREVQSILNLQSLHKCQIRLITFYKDMWPCYMHILQPLSDLAILLNSIGVKNSSRLWRHFTTLSQHHKTFQYL